MKTSWLLTAAFACAAILCAGPGRSAAAGVELTLTETALGKAPFDPVAPCVVSRDGRHVLFGVARKGSGPDGADQWAVAVDGEEGKNAYDQLGTLRFSPDGKRTAFTGKRGESWVAVIDGVEGKPYGNVERLRFSADGSRVGYIADLPDSRMAVIDGAAQKAYIGGVSNLVFSADGKHAAYVAGRGTPLNNHTDDVVVVDGTEGKPFPQIVVGSLRYSPDGKRLAFAAMLPARTPSGQELRVLVDGKQGAKGYDDLKEGPHGDRVVRFSPDGKHLAFVARRGDKWLLVVDDREGKLYEDVKADSFQFSPDGGHWAFVAEQDEKFLAVVDGKEGKPCDEVSAFQFGADGRHFAYLARQGNQQVCVTDAGSGKAYPTVSRLVLSADGLHVAYTALRDDSKAVVVLDGKEQKAYLQAYDDSLHFSPDGKHLAYVASAPGDPKDGGVKTVVVLDGAETQSYGLDLPDFRTLTFSPDGRHLAYTVFKLTDPTPQTVVVVDGVESKGFDQALPQGKLVFDAADKLHLLATRDGKVARIDVEIKEK